MSPRVRADAQDGLFRLHIQSAVAEDAGVYRIQVRNPDSDISSQCTLNVYETNTPNTTAPLFTSSIKGMRFQDFIEKPFVFHYLCVSQQI